MFGLFSKMKQLVIRERLNTTNNINVGNFMRAMITFRACCRTTLNEYTFNVLTNTVTKTTDLLGTACINPFRTWWASYILMLPEHHLVYKTCLILFELYNMHQCLSFEGTQGIMKRQCHVEKKLRKTNWKRDTWKQMLCLLKRFCSTM